MKSRPLLSPHSRHVLLDALRPPAGFQLDRAVGTCFSVNLMSALLVPMSFALFDTEGEGSNARNTDGGPDPVKTLTAVQTYASRMTLYCERGRIAAAAKVPAVLGYIEDSLRPVKPPPNGSFHPKLWVMRFISNNGEALTHRVLCLSRNLTFDQSWDTILRLEEGPAGQRGQSTPLVDFLEQLNALGSSAHARSLAESVASASFAPPKGFDKLRFFPMMQGVDDDPLGTGDDLFVASPFVGATKLTELQRKWGRVQLASRGETIDRLDPQLTRSLHRAYAFDAIGNEVSSRLVAVTEESEESVGLSGLHAKLYSGETNGKSFVLVGSANCTSAAFDRNVEFCVRLEAKDKTAGPRALLRERNDNAGLAALLQPHPLRATATEPSDIELGLERLEKVRRDIAAIPLVALATRRPDDSFELRLRTEARLPDLGKGDKLHCWPITLGKSRAVEARTGSFIGSWQINSLVNVTGLIAFELKSPMKGVPAVQFTLKADLQGDVEGRLDAILADILSDPERLLRFLLLLLMAGNENPLDGFGGDPSVGGRSPIGTAGTFTIPLLETLVRAFARDPERLKAFERALRQLERAHGQKDGLPEGLMEVWKPVEAALSSRKRKR